jgi:hypothetical protein
MSAPVFAVLRQATLQEVELHDIATSVINKRAAQAWTIYTGYIFFDRRLYIPAASPLLLALIDALISGGRVHNLNHLEVGFHTLPMSATQTYNLPSSILLTRPWNRGTPLMAAVTFFDNMGCRCMTVIDVAIDINANDHLQSISPYDLNGVDFIFGEMLYLTTTLAYHVPSPTICRKIPSYILPNASNKVWGFEEPPYPKEHFHIDASISKATLVRAQ